MSTPSIAQHINDRSKPLIFLGTNWCLEKYIDVCNENNITIHGVIDTDYYGNTDNIGGVPVIDSEQGLIEKIELYRDFNFFCATNWAPAGPGDHKRTTEKRHRQINLLDSLGVNVISLVDEKANVGSTSKIGRGCFVDAFALIEPYCILEDYVNIFAFVGLGHHTKVDRNSVIQRHCSIGAFQHFEENCFLGVAVKALKTFAVFGKNTFIQESVYIRRGTVADEVVGIGGKNMSRVYTDESRQVL